MLLLISGGLLAIGLLAILALIWLIRTTPAERPAGRGFASERYTPATTSVEITTTAAEETPRALRAAESETLALMNPEFHALATQLRTLHQQSAELEQRLDILIQVVERIERSLPAQTAARTGTDNEAEQQA